MLGSKNNNKIVRILYLVFFLTSVHYAFIIYINSSYLANFIPQESVGLLYVIASVITILIASVLSKLLKKWGQLKTAISILIVDMIAVLAMAAVSSPLYSETSIFPISDGIMLVNNLNSLTPWIPAIVILAFLAFQISVVLNRIILDVYLEEFSKDSETGNDRGWFLTAMNLPYIFAPFIVGEIAAGANDGFWKIYALSAVFIALALIVIIAKLKNIKDVSYHSPPFLQTLRKIYKNKNISSIYISSMLLEFFYSWMTIYTPIYLHENIGLGWDQIGIIFSIMLTSFVILEIPLGKIADRYLGEKEILTAGFIITAISTGLLTFINGKSLIVWTAVLFATRVGASCIEVMNDTYFFKKVKSTDSDIISFFRNASPVAYIIGPALASLCLYFIDSRYLFLILGAIMLSGITFSLSIKDTL